MVTPDEPPPDIPQWRVTAGAQAPSTVERLLRSLPDWFGIEAAIVDYVESAHRLPTYLACTPDGAAAGVLLAARHFPSSAEVHLMAVDRAWHRQGAGRALVAAFEADLIADGASLLQVKTLGPTHPDTAYASTRRFYEALGFLPLEEIHGLWPGNPCLVMVKASPVTVTARGSRRYGRRRPRAPARHSSRRCTRHRARR